MSGGIVQFLSEMALDLLMLAKMIVYGLIIAFTGILYVGGPIAVTMGILFPSAVKKWFMTFLTAKAAIITMMLIEMLILGFRSLAETAFIGSGDPFGGGIIYIMTSLTFTGVICYLMVFWLTAKFIGGDGQAGAFMSAASGAALGLANKGIATIAKMAKK